MIHLHLTFFPFLWGLGRNLVTVFTVATWFVFAACASLSQTSLCRARTPLPFCWLLKGYCNTVSVSLGNMKLESILTISFTVFKYCRWPSFLTNKCPHVLSGSMVAWGILSEMLLLILCSYFISFISMCFLSPRHPTKQHKGLPLYKKSEH